MRQAVSRTAGGPTWNPTLLHEVTVSLGLIWLLWARHISFNNKSTQQWLPHWYPFLYIFCFTWTIFFLGCSRPHSRYVAVQGWKTQNLGVQELCMSQRVKAQGGLTDSETAHMVTEHHGRFLNNAHSWILARTKELCLRVGSRICSLIQRRPRERAGSSAARSDLSPALSWTTFLWFLYSLFEYLMKNIKDYTASVTCYVLSVTWLKSHNFTHTVL